MKEEDKKRKEIERDQSPVSSFNIHHSFSFPSCHYSLIFKSLLSPFSLFPVLPHLSFGYVRIILGESGREW